MDYITPSEARSMSGLRLALTRGVPGPYSMSARSIFDLRNVPYVAVEQIGASDNPELKAWTGHRNAPVAMYNDESPRAGWLDILHLAQRLGSGPSLLPQDIKSRMLMFGLTNELIGESGLTWQLRLVMLGAGGPERAAQAAQQNPMYADYGYSESARQKALSKAQSILEAFTGHVRQQHTAGSDYLIGDTLTALDVYWAYFSQIVAPLPDAQCPTPKGLRKSYEYCGQALGGVDDLLVTRRDWMFAHHLQLPLTF